MGLHAVVLLKQVLDPEIPFKRFAIDPETKRPAAGIASEVLGPFEMSALEVALQLKDAGGVEKITALAAGPPSAQESLRKALSVRADEAVLLNTDDLGELDPHQTAELLAAAIKTIDAVDLVMAGRQAGDWDHGQTGYLIAERLGWPCLSFAQNAAVAEGMLKIRREFGGGWEFLAVPPPAVVTVTNHDTNVLRTARLPDLMKARRRSVTQWDPADVGLDPASLAGAAAAEVLDVRIPPEKETDCEFIRATEPAEAAAQLVRRLQELKVL
ncbi:MAG: electron transfer flavoprotein subunit beta/FixA family protein [Thermaerobacterales bacterium]